MHSQIIFLSLFIYILNACLWFDNDRFFAYLYIYIYIYIHVGLIMLLFKAV